MERDALSGVPLQYEDLVPPPTAAATRAIGFVGLGLVAAAALLGVVQESMGADPPWILSTVRLWLVGLGAAVAGYAMTLRSGLPQIWLLAAATTLLAGGLPHFLDFGPKIGFVGVPEHWDSGRFMLHMFTLVGLAGAGFVALEFATRLWIASGLIVFHFFGIFLATTSPTTQNEAPYWITTQLFNKIYAPYLQFVYLRNAYHFYSPEPGPASLLCFLLKTEVGTEEVNGVKRPKYERRWVVIPKRPDDIKDPLGVSYFRRLSITEQVAAPGSPTLGSELTEIRQRRMMATYDDNGFPKPIPTDPFSLPDAQYRLPSNVTSRYILPSYAQHVIHEECKDQAEMAKSTVMVYTMVHQTASVEEIRRRRDPFTPPKYKAFYLGEFNVEGNIVDPRDAMLNWLVPVYPKAGAKADDQSIQGCEDYLSRHAGLAFDWSSLR